jgi:hypothetical protein
MDNRVQSYVVNLFDSFSPEEKQKLFYALKNERAKVAEFIYENLKEFATRVAFKNVDPIILSDEEVIRYSEELTELLINYFSKEIQDLENQPIS